jgi:hypothetical protein
MFKKTILMATVACLSFGHAAEIDISGLKKTAVLQALYANAKVL